MIRIYFVRHAEPDKTISDDRQRPLTSRGMSDTSYVHQILKDKGIDVAICSPYKRSLDTIRDFLKSSRRKQDVASHSQQYLLDRLGMTSIL